MDITALFGLILGVVFLYLSMTGGSNSIRLYADLPSIIITDGSSFY